MKIKTKMLVIAKDGYPQGKTPPKVLLSTSGGSGEASVGILDYCQIHMRKRLKLYHVLQNVNTDYDTYSDFVCAAENEEEAKFTNPGGFHRWHDDAWYFQYVNGKEKQEKDHTWCNPKDVKITLIGDAESSIEKGIICTSFHAG